MSRPRQLISEQEIEDRVQELAGEISGDFGEADPLVMVGILKGAFVFLADLARTLTIPRRIEFMALSSYGGTRKVRERSRSVRLLMDLRTSIEGEHVLIVEDIVDTGETLEYLVETLSARRPSTLSTCALVRKRTAPEGAPHPDYLGFQIPDEWVVGYGLDYRERYRTLPYIGILGPEELDPGDRDG